MPRLPIEIPAWVRDYVGIPFQARGRSRTGLDCWGLVRLVYAERHGIALPDLDDTYAQVDELQTIAGQVVRQLDGCRSWVRIEPDDIRSGDVAVYHIAGHLGHLGIFVAAGRVLHAIEGVDSCVMRTDLPPWSKRFAFGARFNGPVRIRGSQRFASGPTIDTARPEGETVAEMMSAVGIAPSPFLAVYVAGRRVTPDQWAFVRPRAGRLVTIAAVPLGGGGQNAGKTAARIAASIVVIAIAAYAGAAIGASSSLVAAYGAGGAAAIGAVSTAAISIAGTLALSALIPPPKPRISDGAGEQTSRSITGARNEVRPYSTIPFLCGTHRMVPMYAALPYTEIEGDDQYLRLLFVLGYGPLEIDDLKIGETAIDKFDDVDYEIRPGYPDDDAITLYSNTVEEEQMQILLKEADSWFIKTSNPDAEELSIDFTWPGGLVSFRADGGRAHAECSVDAEYSPVGTNQWRRINEVSPSTPEEMLRMFRTPPSGPNNRGSGLGEGPIAWGTPYAGAKPAYLPLSHFAWEARGFLTFPQAGTYVIAIDGSDSIELRIFNRGLVTRYGAPSPDGTFGANAITIEAPGPGYGFQFVLRMESRSPNGGVVAVGWKRPGSPTFEVVPAEFYRKGSTVGVYDWRWRDTAGFSGTINLTAATRNAIRRSFSWVVPKGQYDIRVRRTTRDTDTPAITDQVYLTAVRTIKRFRPIEMKGLCLVAMRIRATDQLNGILDEFNCMGTSVLPDYDAATGTWPERPTSNPASCYRAVFQHMANARPVQDTKLDLAELEGWHDDCRQRGWKINAIFDTPSTVLDRANDVATVGRATFGMRNGLYSVVRDRRQTTPVQHFTAANSWGFKGRKAFPELPHAWRMQFLDESNGYQRDERIVPFAGYSFKGLDAFGNEAPALPPAEVFETMEVLGLTEASLVWSYARYLEAVAKLRPEVYQLRTDWQHLVCSRGDLVLVTHDVPLWGSGSGWITELVLDSDDNLLGLHLDRTIEMDAGVEYVVRVRLEDGTSFLRPLIAVAGTSDTVMFAQLVGPTDPRPTVGNLWMFGRVGKETRELIVKSIEPEADLSALLSFVDHSPGVHDADQGPIPPFDPGITEPPSWADRPETPVIESIRSDDGVMVRGSDGTLRPRMLIRLRQVGGSRPRASLAQILTRETLEGGSPGPGPFTYHPTVPIEASSVSVLDVEERITYQIRLRTMTALGVASEWVETIHTVEGKLTPPPDVQTFTVVRLSDGTRQYSWTLGVTPPDIAGVTIRYGQTWQTWEQLSPLHADILQASPTELNNPPEGTWRFAIKAIDTSGNESVNAFSVTVTLGPPRLDGVAFSEDSWLAGWPGLKTGCHVAEQVLEADDASTWNTLDDFSAASWDAWPRWNLRPTSPIVYETTAIDAGFLFDFSPDVLVAGDGVLVAEVATSADGSTWSAWQEISDARIAVVRGRYLKAKVSCSAGNGSEIPTIARLLLVMRSTAIVHELQDLLTQELDGSHRFGPGDIRLPIPVGRFTLIRHVSMSFNGMGAGWSWELVDRDPVAGPRVRMYNADYVPADAVVDAVIRGFASADGSLVAPPVDSLDYGFVGEAVSESEDYGSVADAVTDTLDYGSLS